MITPRKLVLHNCGPHAHLEIEFSTGIMGLVGLNGSGKSSVIEGLYLAYTGELLTCEVKDDMLRRGEKTGYVCYEAAADDGPFKVTRLLHKIGHRLEAGDKVLIKKDEVNQYISDRAGIDVKLLGDTAFIAQGMLWNILTGDRLARARAASAMFGLDKAEKIYAASASVNSRIISYPDRTAELDEIKKKLKVAEDEDKLLTREIGTLQKALEGSEETTAMLEEAVKLPDADSTEAIRMDLQNSLILVEDELKQINAGLLGLKEESVEFEDYKNLQAEKEELRSRHEIIEAGKCPTCGQKAPWPMDLAEAAKAFEEVSCKAERAKGVYEENKRLRKSFKDRLIPETVRKNQLTARLADMVNVKTIPSEDKAEYEKLLSRYEELRISLENLDRKRIQVEAVLSSSRDIMGRYEQDQSKYSSGKGGLDLVAEIKKLFHPEGLPSDAMQNRLERYNSLIEKYLVMFKAPFKVRLNTEMVFVCDVGQYRDLGVRTGLSGGQKVLAAVAVMLARAEMLSFGCGVLVLDEPTAYLDEVNLPILVQVLQDADRYLQAEKLVLLIPTHESALKPVLTKTIKL